MDAVRIRFGKITRENFAAAVRLSQAQDIFRAITAARKNGEPLALRCCADAFPRFASTALTDASLPRPALYAAKQALQPLLAIAECDPVLSYGRVLKIPVLLLARNVRPLPVSVTATMYTPEGGVISSVSFSAMPGSEMRLGELNVEIPAGLNHVLLRTAVEQPGEAPIIADSLIGCGDNHMALAALPRTFFSDGKNGDQPAFGVVTENGLRVLLPGESVDGFTGEYFNR